MQSSVQVEEEIPKSTSTISTFYYYFYFYYTCTHTHNPILAGVAGSSDPAAWRCRVSGPAASLALQGLRTRRLALQGLRTRRLHRVGGS